MGVEWEADDPIGQELRKHLNEVVIPANGKLGKRQIPEGSGIGIKPVSKHGSQRHIRKAIQHALRLEGNKRHVTLVPFQAQCVLDGFADVALTAMFAHWLDANARSFWNLSLAELAVCRDDHLIEMLAQLLANGVVGLPLHPHIDVFSIFSIDNDV